MPPKKVAKKLHELAPLIPTGTEILDTGKKNVYTLGKFFAAGGFGRIYTCKKKGESKELVVKIEPAGNGPLFTENNVFQRILKKETIDSFKKEKKLTFLGVPHLISCGIFDYKNEKMRFLIIPKYSECLEALRASKGTLSAANNAAVCRNILRALQYIHEQKYVHADIKADNILLEKTGDFTTSVLVDFGLARFSASNEDKPDKKRAHNGTAIYTSCDAHRGCQPSYRGDVEILAFNVVYWLTGDLPWKAKEADAAAVYDEKLKFIKGLPKVLDTTLQDSELTSFTKKLFQEVAKTDYKGNVNFDDLLKALDSARTKEVKTSTISKTAEIVKTPSTRSRRREPVIEESDEEVEEPASSTSSTKKSTSRGRRIAPKRKKDDEEEEEVKTTSSSRKTQKSRMQTRDKKNSMFVPSEDDDEVAEELENNAPIKSTRRRVVQKRGSDEPLESPTTSKVLKVPKEAHISPTERAAKKIREKYLRRTPRTQVLSDISSPEASQETSEVAEEKPKKTVKYGISPATRSSEAKLRNVPGMRNFPKGRRSIIIKETAARYQKMLAQEAVEEVDEGFFV